jgi:phosphatidylserine/phosphatidylglycerophosphate/cardiolipin synthase-like enzyme
VTGIPASAFKRPLDRVDRAVGERVEQAICAHHARRLRRVGWMRALDPPEDGLWATGDPPARDGCLLEPLVDGENALPRIAEALRGARESVLMAGWHVSADFRLERPGPTLRELLADVASRVPVRLLLWAGAPVPVFKPSRARVREMRDELVRGTRIQCALDDRERPMHCHHEKLVVVDGEVAFVGGIDLTSLAGDRFDRCVHPPRSDVGWHDASSVVRGPVVGDVGDHLRMRWREVTGEQLPHDTAPGPAGEQRVQLVRTVPEKVYDALPRGDFRILEAYTRALRSAERLVYLENQFLWSPEIVAILGHKLAHPPSDEFRVVCLLPAKPNNGNDSTRGQVGVLVEADQRGGGERFTAATIYARDASGRPAPVYVHAKIGIVDDRWLTLGSANLNEHSLFNDTEVNVVCDDPALARETRVRLWAEHLEVSPAEIADSAPHEVIDSRWRPLAFEQRARRERGEPLTHRLTALPHVSRRSRRLLGPLDSFLVDG